MFQHTLQRLSVLILLSTAPVGSRACGTAQGQVGPDSAPPASSAAISSQSLRRPQTSGEASSLDKIRANFFWWSAETLMLTDPQTALVQIKEVMRLHPQDVDTYKVLYARCLARIRAQEEDINDLRAAVKRDPTDHSLLNLYNVLHATGRTQEGVDALKASQKSREIPILYIEALQFLREQDRLKEGMALTDMALEAIAKRGNNLSSDITAAYTFKADILMLQGKPKEAQELWQKVIDLPMKPDYWMKQARVHLAGSMSPPSDGKPGTEANSTVAMAALMQEGPAAAHRHWLKSRDYGKVNNLSAQIFELKEASRLNPEDAYYHYELSGILNQLDLKVEPLAELLAAALVAHEDTYAFYAFDALKTVDCPEAAIEAATKEARKPQYRTAQLYILLGNYYLEKGEYARALKMVDYGFAAKKVPGTPDYFEPDFYLLKGDALHKQNRVQEARAAWQKAADFPNKAIASVQEAQRRLAARP